VITMRGTWRHPMPRNWRRSGSHADAYPGAGNRGALPRSRLLSARHRHRRLAQGRSVESDHADLWEMLAQEVFAPIGIFHAPGGAYAGAGGSWPCRANAGYYPTLDDLAKIALLYQRRGEWEGHALLHRGLVEDLLRAKGALDKTGRCGAPRGRQGPDSALSDGLSLLAVCRSTDGSGL
jgi:CubicO group peptidase (beta-lactamase class C family)